MKLWLSSIHISAARAHTDRPAFDGATHRSSAIAVISHAWENRLDPNMLLLMNNASGNFSLASYYCSHGRRCHGDPTRTQAGIENTDDNRSAHKLEEKKKKRLTPDHLWAQLFDLQILNEK